MNTSMARDKNMLLPQGSVYFIIYKLFSMLFKWFCVIVLLCSTTMAFSQAMLRGQVVDTDGQPMSEANVFVEQIDVGDNTDEQGNFLIQGLQPGSYRLRVSYLGYRTYYEVFEIGNEDRDLQFFITLKKEVKALQELVVSATRANSKTPVTYSDLSKEEIEAANLGQDVPFLLRWTPSAVVTSDAGTGIGYTGIRIRGTDPTRINVTINGIPLNDAESQGVFWVNLPDFSSSVSSIQIQRGAGTSTNGAGAFGATINLSTLNEREDPYVTVGGTAGSFNTLKGNIQLGSGLLNDKFIFSGRLSTIQSDGYIDRASADLNSYALSGTYRGKSSNLQFNLFSGHEITYQAWYGVPADSLATNRTYNSAGTQKEGEPYDNEVDNYRQTHYQLLYTSQLNDNWALNLNGHYTRGRGFFEQYQADQFLTDYGINTGTPEKSTDLIRRLWLDNDFYGTTYALDYAPQDKPLRFTLGGGFNIYEGHHFGEVIWARTAGDSEIGERYYENDAEKQDVNIYGKVNYALTTQLNAYVDLQYRRIDYGFLGIDNDLESVEQSVNLGFFNPKAGLVFQPNNKNAIYASFAVAQREPNRNDYVSSTPANRPDPEKLYDYELGWRHTNRSFGFEANLYFMDYQDQLAINGQLNEVGQAIRINIPESYRLGLELSSKAVLSSKLSIEGNATFSQNRVERFTEFVDEYDAAFNFVGQRQIVREDTDLAFSPDIIAGGGFTYTVFENKKGERLSANWQTKYVGQQFVDNSSDEDNVVNAYSFTNLRIKYRLAPQWMKSIEVTLMARNIFNQLFEANAYSYRYYFDGNQTVDQWVYPQAGANFLLGVNLDF